ncbi:hypothetical protein [Streptococcus infantis]|uniref:hypothetical protein n=1 Tax=Streptococcus infantis TaxID=68892 RepID=UPI0039C3D8A5
MSIVLIISSDFNCSNSHILIKPLHECWALDSNDKIKYIQINYKDQSNHVLTAYEVVFTDKFYKKTEITNFVEKIACGDLKLVCSDTRLVEDSKIAWKFKDLPKTKLIIFDHHDRKNMDDNLIINTIQEILFSKKWTKDTLTDKDISDAIELAVYEHIIS